MEKDKGTGVEATLALHPEGIGSPAGSLAPAEAAQTLVLPGEPTAADQPGNAPTVFAKGTAPGTPVPDGDRYTVLDEIGRGGLGRVVRATDRKLDRTVAIKQLHKTDDAIERRFMGEALVTARLQHPSIVPIYDTGRDGDAPFYAMKLVDGQSLAEVLENKDTLAARLPHVSTVLAVANAIAFAHSQKVIHRDLKPHNVIVGEFGETVVIDWGLAKHLGDADTVSRKSMEKGDPQKGDSQKGGPVTGDHTVVGDVLGTPAYMPPEQAKGEPLDERADVFALGAMLYHVLAGRPPYVGGHADVTLGLARLGRSPRLESLVDVPLDLLAIVTRAMALDPDARYPSAREFADDLRRYTTGQLVGSHRYTSWQLLRRWVRRHRGAVAVGAVLLVVLGVASAMFVRQIQRERDVADTERDDARAQRAEAERRKNEAETRRAAAEDLVGFMLSELKPGLTRLGRLDLMRGVAKQVDTYYERVTNIDDLDATALGRRAEAMRTMGEVLDIAGEVPAARRAFETAIQHLTASKAAPHRLAHVQIDLALVHQEQGEIDVAFALLARVESALAGHKSADVDYALARLYRRRGILETGRGKLAEAATALRESIARARAALKVQPKLRDAKREQAAAHDRLSDVLHASGELAKAIDEVRAGLALREELARQDPGDIEIKSALQISWDKIYNLAVPSRDFELANKASQQALAIAELLVTIDPENNDWARSLIMAKARPAMLAYERDDFATAVRLQEGVVTLAQLRVDRDPTYPRALSDLFDQLGVLGNFLTFANQTERALEVLRRAQKIGEDLQQRLPDDVEVRRGLATLHQFMGDVLFQSKDYRAAHDAYRARIVIDEELLQLDPTNPRRKVDLAHTQYLSGVTETFLPGQREAGLALLQRSLDTFRALEKAGELSPDMKATIPEREKMLAGRKLAPP